jgi:hypothetical protein
MLVRDSRTTANGAFGRDERHESAGMRLLTAKTGSPLGSAINKIKDLARNLATLATGFSNRRATLRFQNSRDSGKIPLDSSSLLNYRRKNRLIWRRKRYMERGFMLEKTEAVVPSAKAEKRQKFVKLAENRTRNAIKAIRVIGKLGNKNAYQFDESDVQKIVRALSKELDALKARMSSTGAKESIDFKL